ncbi:Uncharacterized protein Fot_14145 [Forsythia ovata]|uniref:Uncharacterized protein n=1 Tax=Forsythia ovata TaxID=205694 RepID=A0ABD1W5R5_9LAMI
MASPTLPTLILSIPNTYNEEPQSGKRKRNKAVIEEIETLRFQLFKSTVKDKEDEFFILQMHKKDGKKEVERANRFCIGELEMVPIVEKTRGLLVDTKYNLQLQERLVGWTSEVRKRIGPSNMTDKYYKHEKVGKIFRSLPEVGTFILFNTVPKDSRKGKKTKEEKNLENKDEDASNNTRFSLYQLLGEAYLMECRSDIAHLTKEVVFNCTILSLLASKRIFTSHEEPQSGKRKRNKSVIEEIETLSFQLFKSTIKDKDDEFFILQMRKIRAKHVINYKLSIHEKDGKKEVEKANRFCVGELEMVPVIEETHGLLVDTKYNLPLQERLVGWTSEVRKRSGPSNTIDKLAFVFHFLNLLSSGGVWHNQNKVWILIYD